MDAGGLALGYAAGALSTLSPCVLPLLPILLASAAQQHALGVLALGLGIAASFAAMGILVASVGLSLGIDPAMVRGTSATLMVALGLVLVVPSWQEAVVRAAAPFTAWSGQLLGRLPASGGAAQLLLGLLLGVVWSPCAGPTLGAAIGLAAQRGTLGEAATVMTAFGIGAATPLVALAYGSRRVVVARRDRLRRLAGVAKPMLGVAIGATGLVVLAGLDKQLETHLTKLMPEWLLDLTTRL
jgi:cytochrome c biogenesis protein CcdA